MKFQVFLLSFLFASVASGQDVHRYPEGDVFYAANIESSSIDFVQDDRKLCIQLGLDDTFSVEQKKIIKKSLRIFLERSLKKSIVDCAYRNSIKDLPESPRFFETQLSSALSVLALNSELRMPSFVFIARYFNDPTSVGLGYVGSFYEEDKVFPGQRCRHYLHVALNSDHLGEHATSGYMHRGNTDYWAGVLAHEFLHNLDYRHPGLKKGSFIYEYQKCVHRNGADADDLDGELPDIEVEKSL